jgi:hypothetical protein
MHGADAETVLETGRLVETSAFATYQREATLAIVPAKAEERIERCITRLETALALAKT